MARMYDRLLAGMGEEAVYRTAGGVEYPSMGLPQDLWPILRTAPVFAGDNVARFYFEGTDKDHWKPQDFPIVTPPFESMWVEFRAPETIVSANEGVVPWGSARPNAWAWLLLAEPKSEETVIRHDG